MAKTIPKSDLFASLREEIAAHRAELQEDLAPRADEELAWRPSPGEWSVLECLDHLVSTHAYYEPLLDAAAADAAPARGEGDADGYAPSFLGGIYLWFQKPRFRFPAPSDLAPRPDLDRGTLQAYGACLDRLEARLQAFASADLRATRVPLEMGVRFNLGDVLRFLVIHDELHLDQARRVLAAIPETDDA